MREYDPESGTYQNAEVDSETKEIRYGECNPEEEEIVYERPKWYHHHPQLHKHWWFWVIVAVVLIVPWVVVLLTRPSAEQVQQEIKEIVLEVVDTNALKGDTIVVEPKTVFTEADSSDCGEAYTEIIETTVNGKTLTIYDVHYGVRELFVGDIDPTDSSIVFAARAADVGKANEILGVFIDKGEIKGSGSKHKEGFCAIINNEITLGVDTITPLQLETQQQKGYFFRNSPLVNMGIACAYDGDYNQLSTRRALCYYNGKIVFVTCDAITMTDFSMALADMGVQTAVYMVGAKGGYGFCRDINGKFHSWGKNCYQFYSNVNYLVYRKRQK